MNTLKIDSSIRLLCIHIEFHAFAVVLEQKERQFRVKDKLTPRMNLKCHFNNRRERRQDNAAVKFVLGKAKIRFLEVLFTRFVFANT